MTIIEILSKYDIPYWTEGKNVSEDTINVKCPFCNDHSNHCGIFKTNMVYSCWRCRAKGHLSKLLVTITGMSWFEAKSACEGFESIEEPKVEKTMGKVEYPESFEVVTQDTDCLLLEQWLIRRKIDKQTLLRYKCGLCYFGDFAGRLIIPVYNNGELVAYQGADLSGKSDLKYKTSIANINNYLYLYETINKRMILTEGMLDAWRIGQDVCSSWGTHLTTEQRDLIIAKKLNTLIFAWDSDAYMKARKEAEFFKPFINNIFTIHFPYGEDPDSYGTEATNKLILEKEFSRTF